MGGVRGGPIQGHWHAESLEEKITQRAGAELRVDEFEFESSPSQHSAPATAELLAKWLTSAASEQLMRADELGLRAVLSPGPDLSKKRPSPNRVTQFFHDPQNSHTLAMFAAGLALFLLSNVCGTIVRGAQDPVLPRKSGARERPHLPPLLISPYRQHASRRAG